MGGGDLELRHLWTFAIKITLDYRCKKNEKMLDTTGAFFEKNRHSGGGLLSNFVTVGENHTSLSGKKEKNVWNYKRFLMKKSTFLFFVFVFVFFCFFFVLFFFGGGGVKKKSRSSRSVLQK